MEELRSLQFYLKKIFFSSCIERKQQFQLIELKLILIYLMSRRALPSRATRGAKPAKTIEEENKDNEIYARMFGNDLDDEQDYEQKKSQQNLRRERTAYNLKKYSYARGYTYCFNLDIFPRLQNHPSYAIDESNVFASTYSRQNMLYKNIPLGSLINRIYFGLPYTEHDQRRREQQNTKNICHSYLFQNEDKKYHLDRMILSYRKIYENLEKIMKRGKINQYSILKKDPQLEEIIKSERALEEKKSCLLKKIRILEQRKANNVNAWYYEDQLFYYHSLNQKLHCQIEEEKRKVESSRMFAIAFVNQYYLKTMIEQQTYKLQGFFKTAFTYYNSQQLVLSHPLYQTISTKYADTILSTLNNQPRVAFPCQFFYFGSHRLLEVLNSILAGKIQNMNEANYYTAKFAWRKLFKYELLPNKLQKLKIEEYTALAKRLVEQSKYFYKENPQVHRQSITIDEMVNLQQLNSNHDTVVSIIKPGESIEINDKEIIIICLYNAICQAFQELLPFAEKHGEDFTHFMTCELFGKYSHGLVEAIGKPIVGTIKHNIQSLCEVLSGEPLATFEFALHFQFDRERNVGILWKKSKSQQGWQTQKEQEEEEGELEEESPSKRRKQNEQF